MNRWLSCIGTLLALSAGASAHAQAITEICYSADQPAASATPPTNATTFTCPASGVRTLPQLASAGFQVVRLTPVSGAAGQTVRQQLVVERPVVIHEDGFEQAADSVHTMRNARGTCGMAERAQPKAVVIGRTPTGSTACALAAFGSTTRSGLS